MENSIKYRNIGSSQIRVSAIGAGARVWGVEPFGWGKEYTKDDLFATYTALLDAGVNYFDTSESYGKGLSEELLGEFRRRDGREIVISTKFTPFKPYDPEPNFSPKAVMPVLEGSLKRLGVSMVDLYQIHYAPARYRLNGYLDALAETVKSGKAKAIGVSNFSTDLLRYSYDYLVKKYDIKLASNQVGYSLLNRLPETNGMLNICNELNMSLIAILPLAEGVLAGKYRPGGAKPSKMVSIMLRAIQILEHHVPPSKYFTTPLSLQPDKLEPLFVVMEEIAAAHNATISQVALNWLLASNPLVIPIPGVKNVAQASSNAAALSWSLSVEEFELLCETEASCANA